MKEFDRMIKNIIGNKQYGGRNDIDGDGVLNRKDCQPRNTMRQDFGSGWRYKGHKVVLREDVSNHDPITVLYTIIVDGKDIAFKWAYGDKELIPADKYVKKKARDYIDKLESSKR